MILVAGEIGAAALALVALAEIVTVKGMTEGNPTMWMRGMTKIVIVTVLKEKRTETTTTIGGAGGVGVLSGVARAQ